MSKIFSSLTAVLPESLNQSEFTKAEKRAEILSHLKILKDSSDALVTHTKSFEASYGYIASSLSRDLKDIYGRFERGSTSEARYLLHQVSENCASCHMKLPDAGNAPKMDHFFKNVNIQSLPKAEQARLQTALRQFDDALKTWEDMFAAGDKPAELLMMDSLTEYLKVAIRVKDEPKRALKTLKALSAKPNLPKFMQRELQAWQSSLVKLSRTPPTGNPLASAKKMILSAQNTMDYPHDRVGMVDFIAASGLLNRFLNGDKVTKEDKALAFYLLGQTESLIGRSTWVSQTAFYYEAAVRTAPKTKTARLAYEALEQQTLLEYSGSGGLHLPADVRDNLDALRQLISVN